MTYTLDQIILIGIIISGAMYFLVPLFYKLEKSFYDRFPRLFGFIGEKRNIESPSDWIRRKRILIIVFILLSLIVMLYIKYKLSSQH